MTTDDDADVAGDDECEGDDADADATEGEEPTTVGNMTDEELKERSEAAQDDDHEHGEDAIDTSGGPGLRPPVDEPREDDGDGEEGGEGDEGDDGGGAGEGA